MNYKYSNWYFKERTQINPYYYFYINYIRRWNKNPKNIDIPERSCSICKEYYKPICMLSDNEVKGRCIMTSTHEKCLSKWIEEHKVVGNKPVKN